MGQDTYATGLHGGGIRQACQPHRRRRGLDAVIPRRPAHDTSYVINRSGNSADPPAGIRPGRLPVMPG